MGPYYGNISIGQSVFMIFETVDADGGEVDFDTPDPSWRVYRDDNTTQTTSGITFTERFDGLTGIHIVEIDTSASASFFIPGNDYHVVGTGLTINGEQFKVSLGSFSIENRDEGVTYLGTVTNTPADGSAFRDSALAATDDAYNNMLVVFLDGPNGSPVRIPRRVEDYDGTNKELIFSADPFPFTPANGNYYKLFGRAD